MDLSNAKITFKYSKKLVVQNTNYCDSGNFDSFCAGDVGNLAVSGSQVRFDIKHGGTSVANYLSSVGVEASLAPFVLSAEVSADTTQSKTFQLTGLKNTTVSDNLSVFNLSIIALKLSESTQS